MHDPGGEQPRPDDPDAARSSEPPEGLLMGPDALMGPDSLLGTDSLSAMAAFCGAAGAEDLASTTEVLDDRTYFSTGAVLGELLATQPEIVAGGIEGFGPLRWFPYDTREPETSVPLIGWVGLPAGEPLVDAGEPLAVRIGLGPLGTTLEVFGAPGTQDRTGQALAEIAARRRARNPLRGRSVRLSGVSGQLGFRLLDPRPIERGHLVVRPEVWELLECHVHDFLMAGGDLRAHGFGMHAAVLVVGPSGTGKTALCRTLASELAGEVTILHVDPVTARDALAEVYALASQVAPALVLIEHAEGAGPLRGTDAPTALAQFLTALDLADDALGPIVTVFTTNEAAAVDASVRNGGRLDVTIELSLPDLPHRSQILAAQLRAAGVDPAALDVGAVARLTDGATGADLQHIVRLALLETDGNPDTAALLSRARARGWASGDTGLYL